ncbi:multiple inositol polyphosphate phosphatase 1a isoform X1 [Brachyhypopomus gauderio]|uniref:multiple inositol polyphosphate phosphatase 1a isoform X1 n=1 Tax=Brachyhypopomus gauderio TaxID=698409 RepID=UPI0040425183
MDFGTDPPHCSRNVNAHPLTESPVTRDAHGLSTFIRKHSIGKSGAITGLEVDGKMVERIFSMVCFILHFIIFCLAFVSADASAVDIRVLAQYFGTKSRYEEVNPYLIDNVLAVNDSAVKPPAPDCEAVHLTAVIRHGTRYPTVGNIKKFQTFYDLVIAAAAGDWSSQPEIKSWQMWYKYEMDGRLVNKGRKDLRYLGQRLVRSFPSLLTEDSLRKGRVKFITSSKHRCVNSTIAFQQGIMDSLGIQGEALEHIVNDTLMRFFDQCQRLVETVEKNKVAMTQVTLFNSGAEMKRVQEKLADTLQMPYANITLDSVEAAFYLCAHEFTICDTVSPWCKLFDESDAQVMEYSGDLKQYWKRGFGYDINSKASCILFHDLFSRLNTVASQTRRGLPVAELVTVQVGHAETLLPLLTLLGLFKDSAPLTSSNFAAQHNRVFRTGQIVPYAANLLVVLYNCSEGLRLQVRLNEHPLTLPGLGDPSPLFEDVRRQYAQLLQGCDQETVCKLDT